MSNRIEQQEDTHFRVLRLLEENPSLSQRELAKALGISLGKANYCLRSLLEKGLIKINNFKSSESKLTYAYLLTPAGFIQKAAITAIFLKRKLDEYERLKVEIQSLQSEIEKPAQTTSRFSKKI